MLDKNKMICDGNEATADIAYRLTDMAVIYPITPSSPMAENYELWGTKDKKNIFNSVPHVSEMQSEAGAIGAVHGALQAGSITTTFTASQGLLLMIPNMYKIAGELHPFVMHVSARTIATHALSIFGDHSDVMACRQTGFAMLAANNAQECHDLALVSHIATFKSRVPFLHFFDGFRTSHEINLIEKIEDSVIEKMLPVDSIKEFRQRALVPTNPNIRGTSQNPDVFFQAREASNPYYNNVENIVAKTMDEFETLTGRSYHLIDYVGAKDPESVIVAMGSGCDTIEETIKVLNKQNYNVGLLKIRLYRPFPTKYFAEILPKSVKKIAVLDRTKESGSVGEPLYLDVVSSLKETGRDNIKVIGGRYGLSSKEFTPPMVKAVFDELATNTPKQEFTIGINDDLTKLSLAYDNNFSLENDTYSAMFYGLGSDGTVGANKNSIKIILSETDKYGQAYFEYDSKKSGATTTSHLRVSDNPIKQPYLVSEADFIAVHHFPLFYKLNILKNIKENGILLINSPFKKELLWNNLPLETQTEIIKKHIKVFAINAFAVARDCGMGRIINTIMQTAFFHLSKVIDDNVAITAIKKAIEKTYAKKGVEVVEKNCKAVDNAISNLYELEVPDAVSKDAKPMPMVVSADAPEIVKRLHGQIISGRGNELPVSAFTPDGTFITATSQYEKNTIALSIPVWNPNTCIQCGKCAFICPHGAIRTKVMTQEQLKDAPNTFKVAKYKTKELGEDLYYCVQVSPRDCTGCGLCVGACPVKTPNGDGTTSTCITMQPIENHLETEDANFKFFATIPYIEREKLNPSMPKHTQLMQPLFEYSGACAGCGEAPYIKLLTQLFGDRMMIANATGCSSIYGGNLPTTPYAVNSCGEGPAWSNSLFEDNAEYAFGQVLAVDKLKADAEQLLKNLSADLGDDFTSEILTSKQETELEIKNQKERIKILKEKLKSLNNNVAKQLLPLADYLIKKSIWAFGGDGWAYDIGFGGLDHILNMPHNINVLVLDTEVYSNTGGQSSKSTPIGASAKFATKGKSFHKKDLGMVAMSSGFNTYVAHIAMGANEMQTIKALREAESFNGPSLVIAYAPCIAHGINMLIGPEQQKLAVETGHWPLYRYDPRLIDQGKAPLQLDSRLSTKDLRDYLLKENRYKIVAKENPEQFEAMVKQREFEIKYKYNLYKYLSQFQMTAE